MPKKSSGLPREANRTKLPLAVKYQLLMEAGYQCSNPTCRMILILELHHIEYVSEGGSNDPSNLLVLCPNCHTMHHAGIIPVEAIRLWKGFLVGLNQAFDRQGVDLLLLLHDSFNQLWFSSDGVLKFAGLISAGLVCILTTQTSRKAPGEPRQFTQTSHHLGLTQKGRLLVDAWLAGDEKGYQQLIAGEIEGLGAPDA